MKRGTFRSIIVIVILLGIRLDASAKELPSPLDDARLFCTSLAEAYWYRPKGKPQKAISTCAKFVQTDDKFQQLARFHACIRRDIKKQPRALSELNATLNLARSRVTCLAPYKSDAEAEADLEYFYSAMKRKKSPLRNWRKRIHIKPIRD